MKTGRAAVRTAPLGLGPRGFLPNFYDLAIFILVAAAFVAMAHGAREMGAPLQRLELAPVELDPANLPEYALSPTLRFLPRPRLPLFFPFTVARRAAKRREPDFLIIPGLDVLNGRAGKTRNSALGFFAASVATVKVNRSDRRIAAK